MEIAMKHLILTLGCALLLTACASPPSANSAISPVPLEQLFHDSAFAPPSEPVDAKDLFAVTPEMIRFLRVDLAPLMRTEGRQRGLYEALQSRDYLKLDFDASNTRNAAQAFRDRSGNCLSLVILSTALGREMGLQTMLQQVIDEESWGLSGDMVVVSGHVNVVFGQRNSQSFGDDSQSLTVDFLPSSAVRGRRSRPISEDTVRAMFQNNRAVEAMARGAFDDAYWWSRASLQIAPRMETNLNTLGVIYQRRGMLAEAEAAYRQALVVAPENLRTMANLVTLLTQQGRPSEAQSLGRQMASMSPKLQPFHHFRLGLEAAQHGDWAASRDHLMREIERDPGFADAQVWLSQAYLQLGQTDLARHHLALAARHATTPNSRALYGAKLDRLQALAGH
jgi:Tfp pilus assembly protein PilF